MGEIVTSEQMEMQAEYFANFLESGTCWQVDDNNVATFGALYKNGASSPVTLKGITAVEGFKVEGDAVKVPAAAYESETQVSLSTSGDYYIDFQGSVNAFVETNSSCVLASAGNSSIYNNKTYAKITLAGGNSFASNTAANVTLCGTGMGDTFYSGGNYCKISTGASSSVSAAGNYVTITPSGDYNSITCAGTYSSVTNLSSHDSVNFTNSNARSTLLYADSTQNMTVAARNVHVEGNTKNNLITVLPRDGTAVTTGLTLNGGAGNDTIDLTRDTVGSSRGTHLILHNPAGTNYTSVTGFTANDTLKITGAYNLDYIKANSGVTGSNAANPNNTFYAINFSASNRVIVGGLPGGTAIRMIDSSGNIIIPDLKIPKTIRYDDSANALTLTSAHNGYDIDMAAGNDTVVINGASSVYVNGGAGNDVFTLTSAQDCTIYCGAGQDTIYNNDSLQGHLYQVKGTDGNKYIRGFSRYDSLQIVDDSTFTPTVFAPSGTNYLPVRIGNSYIYLQGEDFNNIAIVPIYDKNGNLISAGSNGVLISGSTTAVTISGSGTVAGCNSSITGSKGNDKFYNDYDGVTIIGGGGNDTIYNTAHGLKGNTYVFPFCHVSSAASVNTRYIDGFYADVDTISFVKSAENEDSLKSTAVTVNTASRQATIVSASRYEYESKLILTLQEPLTANEIKVINKGTAKTLPITYSYPGTAAFTNDKWLRLSATAACTVNNVVDNSRIALSAAGACLNQNADGCTLTGGSGAQSFSITGSNNAITVGSGADSVTLVAGSANNTVFSSNNTMYVLNNGSGSYIGAYLHSSVEAVTISGWHTNDTLYSTSSSSIKSSEAVSGGVKLNFDAYGYNFGSVTILGLSKGSTFYFKNTNMAKAITA